MGNYAPVSPIDREAEELLLLLNVDRRAQTKVWRLFLRHDKDCNTFLSLIQVFRLLGEQRSSIVHMLLAGLFLFADRNGSDTISFEDFLVSFSCYCALNREELLQFVFMVIDDDRNGYITKKEFDQYVHFTVLHQEQRLAYKVFGRNVHRVPFLFREGKWNRLYFDEFAQMCDEFPYTCFPAFFLQSRIRKVFLGHRHWARVDEERRQALQDKSACQWEAESARFEPLFEGSSFPIRMSQSEKRDIWSHLSQVTMRDILALAKSVKDRESRGKVTEEVGAVLSKSPLLRMIRNTKCAYYIPLTSVVKDASQRAIDKRPDLSKTQSRVLESEAGTEDTGRPPDRTPPKATGKAAAKMVAHEGLSQLIRAPSRADADRSTTPPVGTLVLPIARLRSNRKVAPEASSDTLGSSVQTGKTPPTAPLVAKSVSTWLMRREASGTNPPSSGAGASRAATEEMMV
ncbi:unnamed protein product [Vitrella brassicaformis CCMP3155]|uniref:EF-hand domain-containing protein n=1 Tax=Vitrella brassicaformis (strain CCMP3155) TaxID=1169540 RepID=A0A0G4GGC0_VITBC|nr:unnamed protein product [Vitrella brassicaformis CCMP3155]|eukprot:CEM28663.1 unnamed protein product [Vitrella brassicaformis CCMP3155]